MNNDCLYLKTAYQKTRFLLNSFGINSICDDCYIGDLGMCDGAGYQTKGKRIMISDSDPRVDRSINRRVFQSEKRGDIYFLFDSDGEFYYVLLGQDKDYRFIMNHNMVCG